MVSLIQPPSDPLRDAIPPAVRDEWRKNPTPELTRRLQVLSACGDGPSDDLQAMRLVLRKAQRAAWETYAYCAFACGFFEGDKGKDLRGRLASRNPKDFRSAMAECLSCWFLGGKIGLQVAAEARGRNAKVLDMSAVIDGQAVGVEVKAPYRETPLEPWCGDDADVLVDCLNSANKKFSSGIANLLIIVPKLRAPVFSDREQLVHALYGETKITLQVDSRTGAGGEEGMEFFPEGRLLRRRLPNGKPVKPGGGPGYTRVSAVIVVEERIRQRWARHPHSARMTEAWIDHDILAAHNPHARYPISPAFFRGYVQFMDLGKGYGWSDGEPL